MILENKLGIKDDAKLALEEERISKKKAVELLDNNIFNELKIEKISSLTIIHHYLFENLYDFAGKICSSDVTNDHCSSEIALNITQAVSVVAELPQSTFDQIVKKYIALCAIHPFVKGNGRSIRIWFNLILKSKLKKVVDWSKIEKEKYIKAMEHSIVSDVEIKQLMQKALVDDINSRDLYISNIDASYSYSGFDTFKTKDLFTKIGIIDADLLGRNKHRFPNLACEKISGYWKARGATVKLLDNYNWGDEYDHVYVSKVFTDTPMPVELTETEKIHIGGTGFFFDQAPNLPDEIEHHMPDYHLYDEWIENQVAKARDERGDSFNEKSFRLKFKEYKDYCIGFLTRGCFRKCEFCVNKKYDHAFKHSPLDEFYYEDCKKICLLDDNFFGCPHWKEMLLELKAKNKPFKFKQGLDERLLTEEKCEMLFSSNYDGDFIFAFDKISDYDLIHEKLKMIRKYSSSKNIKFYVLTGFDSTDHVDIENTFKRIALLLKYECLPYLMRYQDKNKTPWKESPYAGMYIAMARWCNQPSILKKMSFRYFCEANQALRSNQDTYCSSMKAMTEFEKAHPEIAEKYFDLKFGEITDEI